MDFNNFIYSKDKLPVESAKRTLFYEDLKNKFYDELKKSDAHNDYFNKYDPDSVESFKLKYATQKAYAAQYYEIIARDTYQYKELKYRENAEEIFEYILQKKLWDIQLQWRAGNIKIKEIRTTWDFHFWEDHIKSCPFLPPVTETEVEALKQFLCDDNYCNQIQNWRTSWQNYSDLMKKDEDGDLSALPEWYEFYDFSLRTGILLQLPNTYGEREKYYENLGRKVLNEEAQKLLLQPPQTQYIPSLPYISSGINGIYKYASHFEKDNYFIELFRIQKEKYQTKETYSKISNEHIYKAVDILKEAEAPVIIQGGCDWREAIVKCSQQYLNGIIAKELDVVFDEYKLFAQIGLSKSNNDKDILVEFENFDLSRNAIERILKGREICGEPRDLNF